jgi:iron complex transport system permease protein
VSATMTTFPTSTPTAARAGRALWLSLAAGVAVLALALCSTFWGAADLSAGAVWQALTGAAGDANGDGATIVWQLRLPRVVLAIVVGMHFAVSGMLLQSALRNPLADPGVLGISSGATLAVMLFLLFNVFLGAADSSRLDAYPVAWLPAVAQCGGIATALLVYGLSWRGGAAPARLVLFGVAAGATLQALAMGILAGWGSARVEFVLSWLAGSLYGKDWQHLYPLLPWSVLGALALPLVLRPMGVLALGDDGARSLGLAAEGWRFALVALAASLAASAVAVTGPVGFLGLLVPHMAKKLVGGPPRRQLPLVLLLGAGVALAADLLGRLLIVPDEVPVGAVTALLGAPFFLYLMAQRRNS